MTLGDLLRAMRTHWFRVVIATLLGAVVAGVVAVAMPNTYVATATIALRWIGPDPGVAELTNARYLTREAQTVALLIERPDILDRAAARLDDPRSLAGGVDATVPLDTQLVRVSGSAASPGVAAELATAAAEAMVSASANGAMSPNVDTVLAVAALPPVDPIAPRKSLYLAGGLLAGLLIGVVAALVGTGRRAEELSADPAAPHQSLHVAHVVWVLLVAATVPWRSGTFYSGGADPVVLGKAALSVLALGIAGWAAVRKVPRLPVPAAPGLLLVPYLAVTVIGGIANDAAAPSIVVAVRVAILMATVCLLAAVYPVAELARTLVHVLGACVGIAVITGLGSYSGRLAGGIPPLDPNLLALLSSVIAIWLLAKVLMAKDSLWELAALGGVFIVVVMTGSRTGIAALGAAGAAMILRMTALRMRSVSIIVLSFPPLTYLLLGTTLIASVFTRGGSEDLSNLSNRTIAWEAAGDMDRDGWQRWFGQGLAQKEISVPGQWWDTQMLDSTWVSALVQGGYLGLATVVLLMLLALAHALFAPRAVGAAWFGLLVYLALGGFLESGLFDGTVQFLVFLVAALGAFDGYHQRPRTVDPAGRPMAEATSDGSGSAMLAC